MEAKKDLILPQKLDDNTTLIDMSAEPNAIRYHYILSNLDTTMITNNDLREILISDICSNDDMKNILNQGINMEYSYVSDNSLDTFFVSFSKNDCL